MMVCFGVGCGACIALRFYLPWQNRLRDHAGGVLDVGDSGVSCDNKDGETVAGGEAVLGAAQSAQSLNLADKTDKEILQFRYLY